MKKLLNRLYANLWSILTTQLRNADANKICLRALNI